MKHRTRFARITAATVSVTVGAVTALPLLAATGPGSVPQIEGSWASIPPRALTAYQETDSGCDGLRWELVAAIGEIESGHGTANGATLDENTGEARPWIFGPALDGTSGTARIPIGSWLGWWGLTGPWEQALGPMQFRAPTFDGWGLDGDGDGSTNPHDIDDAAASAANYLCGPDGAVTNERAAVLRYNRSADYADKVVALADDFATVGSATADGWICPVAGPVSFIDSWGAPRSGGRLHQGVDMFARRGTPTVAPVPGVVEHRHNDVGGLSFHLWGDDGNYYYGTHLSEYGSVTGWVDAGSVIGYMGNTGNAAATSPHLHFEIHPGRTRGTPLRPINPTPAVDAACVTSRVDAGITGDE